MLQFFHRYIFVSIILIATISRLDAMVNRSPMQCQDDAEQSSSTINRRHSFAGSRKMSVPGAPYFDEPEDHATKVTDEDLAEQPIHLSSHTANYVSSLIAGVGSGSIASVVCAPLDLVRTRMQVAGGLGKSAQKARMIESIYEIYLADGIRGCFRGLGATLATVPAFWGIYFPLYEELKGRIHDWSADYGDGGNNHQAMVHLSSAVTAGAVADVICNPLFIVRTRMQTEALHSLLNAKSSNVLPQSITSTVKSLYREGGIPIFWRGLTASLLGLCHVGIQFPVYERLKHEARIRSPDGQESPLGLLIASGLSKATAAFLTYPHEVIRSRMMDARGSAAGRSIYRTAYNIIQNEGYAGLYVGLRVSLVRVVPNCCVTFVSYELIARWVRAHMGYSKQGEETK